MVLMVSYLAQLVKLPFQTSLNLTQIQGDWLGHYVTLPTSPAWLVPQPKISREYENSTAVHTHCTCTVQCNSTLYTYNWVPVHTNYIVNEFIEFHMGRSKEPMYRIYALGFINYSHGYISYTPRPWRHGIGILYYESTSICACAITWV